MFQHYSYYGIVRKYAQIFSALFSDLVIHRHNVTTGKTEQVITVPIGYAPRAPWIQRVQQDPSFAQKVATSLPRMSFEMTSLQRDSSRAIIPIQMNSHDDPDNKETRFRQFVQIPYNMGFELSLITNDEDDAWQILEQITPYFQPELTFNTSLIPNMGYAHNVTIVLDNLQLQQPYEGALQERRIISWTLGFTLRGYMYGPVERQGLIKKSIANIRIPEGLHINSDTILTTPVAETYTVRGGLTYDGQPTYDPEKSIPYDRIKPDDNYAYIESWERQYGEGSTTYGTMKPQTGSVVVVAPLSPVAQALSGGNALLQIQYKQAQVAGPIDINHRDGEYCILTLNSNVTDLTIQNWTTGVLGKLTLEVRNNGDFGIANWAGINWVGGFPPVVSPGVGKKDIYLFHTPDGGANVYGSVVGQGYELANT